MSTELRASCGGLDVGGGEGGGPFDLFAPAIVRTKPIETLIIQECSRTINTRDAAEWNGFHAHTFQTRIFRFFGYTLIVIFFIVFIAPELGTLRVVPCR